MEPTEFEKWCAGEMGHTVEYIISHRNKSIFRGVDYKHHEINTRYRAYTAGVMSMLPYQTPAKGATNELD